MADRKNKKQNSKPTKKQHKGEHLLFWGSMRAWIGSIVAAVIALSGQYMVGQIYSGWEARKLLESVINSGLFFGSAAVTGAATILALMLTMLGMTKKSEAEFDSIFFKRIERIGLVSTIVLIAGVLLLLFLSVPIQESNEVPSQWFKIIYYVLITYIAGLSGLMVGVVLMLFNAITSLIDVIKPSMDEDVDDAQEREKHETQEEQEEIDKQDDVDR